MRELRHRRAERAIQQDLLRRVRDVIVAAHHMRDLHLHIVGHDGELIGRLAVGAQDDEVLDVRAVELDRAVDEIVEARRARRARGSGSRAARRRARAPRSRPASARSRCGRSARRRRRARRPRASPSAPRACSSSSRRGRCATSRCGHRAVAIEPLATGSTARSGPPTIGPSSQSSPSQRMPSRMPSTISADDRSTSVSSMRSTNDAAVPAGEQPVEERGARAADVEVAGRRRREADANHPAIVVAGKFPFRAAGRARGRRFRRSSRGRGCRSSGRAARGSRLACR